MNGGNPKTATWLSALTVVGGILASSYQLVELHRQNTKQEALTASLMGAMQEEQKYLRDELHQLRLELYATQERLNDFERSRMKALPEGADGSGGDVSAVPTASAPPSAQSSATPSFPEMRDKAAQGKVWRAGEWHDF